VISLGLLSKYLLTREPRFDAMFYSNLAYENPDADHMQCSCGPQVPHPCFKACASHNCGKYMVSRNSPADRASGLLKPEL